MTERAGKVQMHADLDMSTVVAADKAGSAPLPPTVSQVKLALDTTLTPGKSTMVASFEDPATSRRFDVDVTMTKM